MRNITTSVDDETYRLFRVKAAENGTSVSALVRAYLVALAQAEVAESRFDQLRSLQGDTLAAIDARGAGLRAQDRLPRHALHQR